MSGGKAGRGYEGAAADRDAYVRDNAVAIVRQRDEQIARLRKRITQLENSVRDLKDHLRAVQAKGEGT